MPPKPFDGMQFLIPPLLYKFDPARASPQLPRISEGVCVPADALLTSETVESNAQYHPAGVEYPAPLKLRAAAHILDNPKCVVTGFGALALYGLPCLIEGFDVDFVAGSVQRTQQAGPLQPRIVRGQFRNSETWRAEILGVPFRIVTPELAVVQVLRFIRKHPKLWKVENCGGLEPSKVRAIQLVDASRRYLGVDLAKILSHGSKLLDTRWLASVIAHSSALADSPKETEMRLMAKGIAEKYDLILSEQVEIYQKNRLVTAFDLALIDPRSGLRIGLMYDGAQHWEYKQRQKDASINLEATLQDWVALRYSSGTLKNMPAQLERLLAAKLGTRAAKTG